MRKSQMLGAVCAYVAIVSLNSNAATFDNFTVISGNDIIQGNGVTHTIINNLTINGRWFQNGVGSSTDMIFNGTQTLGGTGELIMSDSINNRLLGDGSNTLTVGTDLTIRGAGKTLNLPDLINNGSILAQGTNEKLLIQTSTLTNNGTLHAEGAGGLHLSGVNVTNNTSVDVNAGSSLELSSNAVINGVINVAGTGTASASQTTFDGVTLNGDMQQNNFKSNTVTNGLTLNGAWNLNSTGSTTGLTFNGTQSIGGAGEIVMSDSAGNRVAGNGNTLTIGSDTVVRGAGTVGFNVATIVNDGQILAQGTANKLLIQSGSLTNNGVLRAEGAGGLHLSGVNVTNNTSVDVNVGSSLELSSNAVINGVINVAGTGTASASQTTFDGVTLNGDMQQNNFKSNTVTNGLTLNGAWNLNATSGTTGLTFNGTQSIGGVGEIVMSDSANNRVAGNGNTLTIGSDTVVRGAGVVGFNVATIVNDGQILAQGAVNTLRIGSSSLTNDGTLRAEGAGGLHIQGTDVANNTSVDVDAGSSLELSSNAKINGVIDVAVLGTARAHQTTFDGVTLYGAMQHGNGDSNTVINGLTLNGKWNMDSTGSTTSLTFNGTQSLSGLGEIVMTDQAGNRILGDGSNTLTVDSFAVIRGSGEVGRNISHIENDGEISARGNDNELWVRSGSLENNGRLSADGLAGMRITGTSFTTNGAVFVAPGSIITRTGDFIQTAAGTTNVAGTLDVSGVIDNQGGRLSGNGTINGTVQNSGTAAPGESPGHLSIDGDYMQSASGALEIEIGGLVAGTEYDWLDVSGEALLDGILNVSLVDAGSGLFAPSLGDAFDILSATDIVGEFDVLMLAALGSGLDWDVNYILDASGTDFVRLSVVSAVPVPATVWLFGSGLLGLVGMARRKKA